MNAETYVNNSLWPTSGGNNRRTGLSTDDMPFPLEIAWTFSECASILGGIIAAKDIVCFADSKGTLYALDITTGNLRWSYFLGGPSYGTPVIPGNCLIIGNSYEAICLDPTDGKEIWKTGAHKKKTREKSANSPLFIRDYVIFCDDFFTVYNITTGDVVTTKNIGSEPHANTGPCSDGENVYIPIHRKIEMLSLETLEPTGEFFVRSKIASGPIIYRDQIVVGLNDSSIEIISTKNKGLSWNYVFSKRECKLVLSRPACAYDMLFAADPFGMIYGFSMNTGHLLWEHHYFERIDSPLIVSNNKLIIAGNEYLFALSTNDGRFVWERGYDSRKVSFPVTSSPSIMKNYLFVGRDKLYAFHSPAST